MNPGRMLPIAVRADERFQTIDGFGVNVNSNYWSDERLIPTMERLRHELSTTLYRVDLLAHRTESTRMAHSGRRRWASGGWQRCTAARWRVAAGQ
jgi:hypothetical protein